ncbi:hypothetical protein ABZ848_09360 [Streptomyces sp. NPDC047081]|uniref:hypothetical protein n=1 Tax=Streptomyces sp. NPDC047081 TaxID=3154706 RepID=UPI0033ED0532
MSWTIERHGRVAVVTMTTNELVPAEELVARAVAVAGETPADCVEQYAFTRRAAQAAALRDIAELSDPLDQEPLAGMKSEGARHAHKRYWQELKGSSAPW